MQGTGRLHFLLPASVHSSDLLLRAWCVGSFQKMRWMHREIRQQESWRAGTFHSWCFKKPRFALDPSATYMERAKAQKQVYRIVTSGFQFKLQGPQLSLKIGFPPSFGCKQLKWFEPALQAIWLTVRGWRSKALQWETGRSQCKSGLRTCPAFPLSIAELAVWPRWILQALNIWSLLHSRLHWAT